MNHIAEALFWAAIIALPAVICGVIGRYLGRTKGNATAGFVCGFFLGPIGWIIALLLPEKAPVDDLAEYKARRAALQRRTSGAKDDAWEKAKREADMS